MGKDIGIMRVAVAMSGGMDSTAAALLLRREGNDVLGLHMRLHAASDGTWEMAQEAARQVGVPIRQVDVSGEFEAIVVTRFIEEYARGLTPSPCPLCNRFVKMSVLLGHARSLGCEKLATGHYARIGGSESDPTLLRGADRKKDQSYFLFLLDGEILRRLLFPLGVLTKAGVKDLLAREGMSAWRSEESQELCFVPGRDYRAFLRGRGIIGHPGPIVDLRGNVLGTHRGVPWYTVGQRRGLGVCGPKPLYVIGIDAATNTVIAGTKDETYREVVTITAINVLVPESLVVGRQCLVKVRSTAAAVPCRVVRSFADTLEVRFDNAQGGVAPGQAAVLYEGERVVGGGWIR
jgi:tRNA-uridine 2-sulfurtransferase